MTSDEANFWEWIYRETLTSSSSNTFSAKEVADAALAARREADAPPKSKGEKFLAKIKAEKGGEGGYFERYEYETVPWDNWQEIADYLETKGNRPVEYRLDGRVRASLTIVTRHGFKSLLLGPKA